MSVYKEGYHAIQLIQSQSKQIYSDACDHGAPTREGDSLWMWVKQLIDWYGVKGTRQQTNYSTGTTVTQEVELMEESIWNNRRTERFRVTYVTTRGNKQHDGYFQVDRVG